MCLKDIELPAQSIYIEGITKGDIIVGVRKKVEGESFYVEHGRIERKC